MMILREMSHCVALIKNFTVSLTHLKPEISNNGPFVL